MLNRWTQRLQSTLEAHLRRPSGEPGRPYPALRTVSRRTEVFPPERLYRVSRWRGGLQQWLNTGWDVSSPAPLATEGNREAAAPEAKPFGEIRRDFADALADVDSDAAPALRARIERARSPRELWHLRSTLYTLVATQHTESEAAARMERLNRHFPLRTLCAGFWTR